VSIRFAHNSGRLLALSALAAGLMLIQPTPVFSAATVSGRVTDPGEGAVVVLEGAGAVLKGAAETPDVPPPVFTVRQSNMRFIPALQLIPVGGVVRFSNDELKIFHHVFSPSPHKEFDLGTYPIGESREVVFTEPGLSEILCNLHSRMYAAVLVTESPYHATVGPAGDFEIRDVTAGTYRLRYVRVSRQSFEIEERVLEVPEDGNVLVDCSGW